MLCRQRVAQEEENESQVNVLPEVRVCCDLASLWKLLRFGTGSVFNVIFKPEKGEGGIPTSTGFLKRSWAMRQIDFLPLFWPVS